MSGEAWMFVIILAIWGLIEAWARLTAGIRSKRK